jgi:hypothetical protein
MGDEELRKMRDSVKETLQTERRTRLRVALLGDAVRCLAAIHEHAPVENLALYVDVAMSKFARAFKSAGLDKSGFDMHAEMEEVLKRVRLGSHRWFTVKDEIEARSKGEGYGKAKEALMGNSLNNSGIAGAKQLLLAVDLAIRDDFDRLYGPNALEWEKIGVTEKDFNFTELMRQNEKTMRETFTIPPGFRAFMAPPYVDASGKAVTGVASTPPPAMRVRFKCACGNVLEEQSPAKMNCRCGRYYSLDVVNGVSIVIGRGWSTTGGAPQHIPHEVMKPAVWKCACGCVHSENAPTGAVKRVNCSCGAAYNVRQEADGKGPSVETVTASMMTPSAARALGRRR